MTPRKKFILLIYLLISCVTAFTIMALATYVGIRFFYFIMYDSPFELSYADTLKYIKVAVYTGIFVGIGGWWSSYQYYNPRK